MKLTSNSDLSSDQIKALSSLLDWHTSQKKNQFITLGGFAGTGKTTLIAILRQQLFKSNKKLKIAFCSFTGKASRVLNQKLKELLAFYPNDNISTIHSLIYSPIVNDKDEIIGWQLKDKLPYDLIVIDEASMVDENIWSDLLSFNLPIIAVGDHGQLPPIHENFNLMLSPQLRLEEIHRQAKGNPIIKLSIWARQYGVIPPGIHSPWVKKLLRTSPDSDQEIESILNCYDHDTLVLCGFNKTRTKLNQYIRGLLNFQGVNPQLGDRVICLRNNHDLEIYNGMLGVIQSIKLKGNDWYESDIKMDGEDDFFSGLISTHQFNNPQSLNFTDQRHSTKNGDLFDFGYALTVHKAQGSQARKVVLFEERFGRMNEDMWRRWLYTAVTRAEEELIIFG